MSIYLDNKKGKLDQSKIYKVDSKINGHKPKSQFKDNRSDKVAQRVLQANIDTTNKINVNSPFNDSTIPVIQRETTEGYKEADATANKKPLPLEEAKLLAEAMILKAKIRIEALRPKEKEKKLEDEGKSVNPKFSILNLIGTKKVVSKVEKIKIEKSKGFNITTDVIADDGKIMASFQNKFEVYKGKIIKMIAGVNVKSKRVEELPSGLDEEKVPINMNEIIHLQYNIARRELRFGKTKKTDLEALNKDQGIGLKDLPFVIERGPTPGTDTGNALNYLIQSEASKQELIYCVIGSPHFSVAFHICRNLGLSMDNVGIAFEKGNPIITIHL